MHFSPDSTRLVFTAGLGERPSAPRVVVRESDGVEVTLMDGARAPCWLDRDTTVMVGPDAVGNMLLKSRAPQWEVAPALLGIVGGNQLAASGKRAASCLSGARFISRSWNDAPLYGTDPALSPDGAWFAYAQPDRPREPLTTLRLEHVATGETRDLYTGAPLNAQFGFASTTLVWEDTGRVFGIADVTNPASGVEELNVPGWRCSKPIAAWTGDALYVGMVLDLGEVGRLVVAEWGALARRDGRGHIVGESGGSAFSWTLAVAA